MASSATATGDSAPLINDNPDLQSYYGSLESRIGYRLLLGGTRHFGYWSHDTWWPFPLLSSLRRMEDQLGSILALPKGATVLDAGCGVGHVALHMATKFGLRMQAIDIVERHIVKARRNIARTKVPAPGGVLSVRRMDYHHLEELESASLDGVYTMETFVHATDPEAVLAGFYRLLRPGGRLALFEYDHLSLDESPDDMAQSMRNINKFAAMPTNDLSQPGIFKGMLEDAGFVDVEVRDFSDNILPMTRLFFLLAYIPFLLVSLLGLERYFINTVAGVSAYRGAKMWRYVAISATKPGGKIDPSKNK